MVKNRPATEGRPALAYRWRGPGAARAPPGRRRRGPACAGPPQTRPPAGCPFDGEIY